MLTRRLAFMLIAGLITFSSPAAANPTDENTEPTPEISGDRYGRVTTSLASSGEPASSGGTGSGGGGPRCYEGDTAVQCKTAAGTWSNTAQCYYRPVDYYVDPQTQAALGEGTLVYCTQFSQDFIFVIPPPTETPPPNPEVLAQQAIERMQLQPIVLGTYPGTLEYGQRMRGNKANPVVPVKWHVWLWADARTPNNWGPISRTVTLDGYSLTATAQVDKITWDMGNGDTITCGKGTMWVKTLNNRNRKSPTCGYLYEETGNYPVTATAHWIIQWEGVGQSGTLTLDLAATETLRVLEFQTLICAGTLEDC